MPTDVRNAPGGDRLLYIDGPVLRAHPGGPRLAWIEEPDVLDAPAGKRLLYLDGDDVRRTPNGPRVAFWDAATLRRAPTWPALLLVDVRDVRGPDGARRYYLDGSMPSMAQLTAALNHLEPSLFDPSDEEQAGVSVRFSADEPPPNVDGIWQMGGTRVDIASMHPGAWLSVTCRSADGAIGWKGIGTRNIGREDRLELIVAMAPDASAELGVMLDGGRSGPIMLWLPRAAAEGHDDALREGAAGGFVASFAPHPRGSGGGREALLAAGGFPVWRLGGREVFTATADGPVQLWYLALDGDALVGELIAGDGSHGNLSLSRE